MASGDATPFPKKNVAYRVTFPIFDNDGDLVTAAAALDSQISKDGGTFVAVTVEATEIATSSGMYFLDLTATEMNADTVAIIIKTTTTDAKTTPIVLYPEEAGDIRVNVTQISDDGAAADNLELDYDGTGFAKANSTIGTTTINTDMRGTDSAALAGVCTEGRLAELDGVNLPTDVAAVKEETVLIAVDTNELQTDDVPGLIAALNDLSTSQVNTEVGTALANIKLDKLISAAVTGVDVADNSIIADLVSKSVTSDYDDFVNTTDSLQAIRNKQTDIETDTAEIGAAGVGLTALGGMSTVMKAQVNAEMVDVESVDLVTQPGQELLAANQTRDKMLAFVYKGFRNKLEQNATEIKMYNDDASTVDQKATISDDGTTYTRNELTTGP